MNNRKKLLKNDNLSSLSMPYKVNNFLSLDYNKNLRNLYVDKKINKQKEKINNKKKKKLFLTNNNKKNLIRFYSENPRGLIKKSKVIESKVSLFCSPRKKKILGIILIIGSINSIYSYATRVIPDTRPVAEEFPIEEILPDNPNVIRDEEGKIVLNPVITEELIASKELLTEEINNTLDYFNIEESVDKIYGIFNYPSTDPSYKENIIDIIISAGSKNYSVQYYDEEKNRKNFEKINEENSTKTLISFIKLLKTCAPYSFTEIGDKNVGEPFEYVYKDGKTSYKIPVYSENFTSFKLFELDENNFNQNYIESISREDAKFEESTNEIEEKGEKVFQQYQPVLKAYDESISSISAIGDNDYISILADYNINKFNKENISKEN